MGILRMTKNKHTMFKRGLLVCICLFFGIVTPAHAAYQYKLKIWNYTNVNIKYYAKSDGCADVEDSGKKIVIPAGKSRTALFNRAGRCSGLQGQAFIDTNYNQGKTPKGGEPFFDGSGIFYFDFSNSGEITLKGKYPQKTLNLDFLLKGKKKGQKLLVCTIKSVLEKMAI